MNEKQFQSLFTKYAKKNFRTTSAFELKICKTNRLAYSKFQPHQLPALYKAKHSCVFHKISDQSAGYKPWDAFNLCNSPAYIVILFYKPRQPKEFIMIDIDDFLKFQTDNPKSKSITKEQCQQIGTIYKL